jgi:hypothetical protein
MLTCLLVGLQTASHRAVSFDKLKEIQHPTENPSDFLGFLTGTLTCYTYSQLPLYFPILPWYSKKNLNRQRMAFNLLSPQGDLVKMAFKVFNNWDQAWDQQKAQLLATALRPPPLTLRQAGQQRTPPGACFKCNQTGHWAKGCPSPRLLPGPCPQCGQNGHWRIDCPSLPPQGRSVSHSGSHQT